MIIFVLVFLCLLAIYLYRQFGKTKETTSRSNQIPLEKGLPIIGVVNMIEKPFYRYLLKLNQKHGPIYGIKFGMRKVVVLNTFEYIKAALLDNAEALTGRWKAERYLYITNNVGMSFIDGHVWAEQRSFVLKTLREFGVGRSKSVELVQDESLYLLEDLRKLTGQSVKLIDFLSVYTINVITKFVMDKRFNHGDPELETLQKFMNVMITDVDTIGQVTMMFPCLENNEWLMKFLMWITSRTTLADAFSRFIEKEVNAHLAKLDFESDGDNLIDKFLIRQRQMRERDGNVETFTDQQLIRNVFDLLMAGIDSVAISLTFSFMFMAMYPEVQRRVHEEIVDKIGKERMPRMGDRMSLTYTQAVMDETFRLASIVPLSLMHRALTEVNVKGHIIPTDTIIITNLFACHHDPNIWEKPFEFYPEHFLSTDSNGDMKYTPREELIIFGMGKRQCLAEPLARIELFIFFISIMQRFQIGLTKEKSYFDPICENDGMLRKPDTESFIFEKRR